jgi:hypothetical protein
VIPTRPAANVPSLQYLRHDASCQSNRLSARVRSGTDEGLGPGLVRRLRAERHRERDLSGRGGDTEHAVPRCTPTAVPRGPGSEAVVSGPCPAEVGEHRVRRRPRPVVVAGEVDRSGEHRDFGWLCAVRSDSQAAAEPCVRQLPRRTVHRLAGQEPQGCRHLVERRAGAGELQDLSQHGEVQPCEPVVETPPAAGRARSRSSVAVAAPGDGVRPCRAAGDRNPLQPRRSSAGLRRTPSRRRRADRAGVREPGERSLNHAVVGCHSPGEKVQPSRNPSSMRLFCARSCGVWVTPGRLGRMCLSSRRRTDARRSSCTWR